MEKIFAPSILAADFARLGDEVRAVEAAGAGWIHLDVMDGHFVPNLTMGPAVARSVRAVTDLPLDAHLMVEKPHDFIEPFAKAGVNALSVHAETCDPVELIPAVKGLGCKAGLVVNPPTGLDRIMPFLMHVDYVLVMTVNPGFAGQEMIEGAVKKIDILKAYREAQRLDFLIEVDGGVNRDTVRAVRNADVIVAGSGIFKTNDYAAAIAGMRRSVGSS